MLATVLVDSRRPYESSSPGWNKIPENIEANLGAFVYFNCYSKLDYDDIHWLVNGEKVDEKATRTNRVSTYNNRHALKYGPIRESDDGTLVGCEIHTSSGVLPSPEGKITVTSKPMAQLFISCFVSCFNLRMRTLCKMACRKGK